MSINFDFVVIGAGVGGYPAAIHLAQEGYRVAIIEKNKIGGECTNYGCIPTKVMVREATIINELKKRSEKLNLNQIYKDILEKREEIVTNIRKGLEYVLEKNDVKIIPGEAKLYTTQPSVKVTLNTGEKTVVDAKKILLATGSYPVCPGNLIVDNESILNSRSILKLSEPPSSIVIIGGGAVGVEYAFIFSSMGSDVYLVEKSENVLSGMDDDVRASVRKALIKQGVKLHLSDMVLSIEKSVKSTIVQTQKVRLEAEKVLVAIGRKPATSELGLENAGIKTDEKGFIIVDEYFQTTNPNFYAVGDVIGHPMLAHKAMYQSLIAAKNMKGEKCLFKKQIPFIVYSIPYAGGVGVIPKKEDILDGKIKVSKFVYSGLAMARIEDGIDGFVKLVYDNDKRIIGAHAFGPESDMIISTLTIAIEKKLTLDEIGEIVYPHPSMSEAIREVALIGSGKPIHTVLFHK